MVKIFRRYIGLKTVILSVSIVAVLMTATLTMQPKKAEAICCSNCCLCILDTVVEDFSQWFQTWFHINLYIYIKLILHQNIWFEYQYWQAKILPAFTQMGGQLAAVGTEQVMAIGMFMDAKEQLETQRLLQKMHAKANKDYQPSVGMCEFGTRIQSLAASERKGEMNALILSERSLDRYLGNKGTGAAGGQKGDIAIRLNAFQEDYCEPYDNNNSLSFICPSNAIGVNPSSARKDRFNKDIDYQRTIEDPWTIGFDLTATPTPLDDTDEEVLAMSNNLYGFESFNRADYTIIKNTASNLNDAQEAYLGMRSVVAKTKVAENSFNALMALKGEGTTGSRAFIESYLEELGISDENGSGSNTDEIDELLGANPSYYAQMEILTKKAYQSPIFYTNLYDKPANVERKGVAMQAIGLIQKFDLFKSNLRTEASLSILLELSVEQLQRQVEDNIQAIASGN